MKVIRVTTPSKFSLLFNFIQQQELDGLRYISHQADDRIGDIYCQFDTTSVSFDDGESKTTFLDLTIGNKA